MYMRMPLSSSQLPIEGKCHVEDDKLMLKFPFTGIEFELPSKLDEKKDFEFSVSRSVWSLLGHSAFLCWFCPDPPPRWVCGV